MKRIIKLIPVNDKDCAPFSGMSLELMTIQKEADTKVVNNGVRKITNYTCVCA